MITSSRKRRPVKRKKVVKPSGSRIEARVSEDEKYILQKAADMLHLSLSDFIRTQLIPSAEKVIEEKECLRLNRKDSEAFVEALRKMPKDASEKFRRGLRKYKKAEQEGKLKSDLS